MNLFITDWFILTGIFLLGLVVGSFLNVIIHRLPAAEEIVWERSHCPHCKKEIPWYDLIPLASFVILRTRCRNCQKPISWQYPLVELVTALWLTLLVAGKGFGVETLVYAVLGAILIVIAGFDGRHLLIPDEFVWAGTLIVALALTLGAFHLIAWPLAWPQALLGLVIFTGFLGLLVVISRGKWMGAGDVKLAVLLGLLAGYPNVLVALFGAFIIGSVAGVLLVVFGRHTIKQAIPFGPFLALGTLIAILYGAPLINWYLHSITIGY